MGYWRVFEEFSRSELVPVAGLIFEPVTVPVEFFVGDFLAANACGHPGAEAGGGNGQMADAETIGILDGAEAQAGGVNLIGALREAVFVFANVDEVFFDD